MLQGPFIYSPELNQKSKKVIAPKSWNVYLCCLFQYTTEDLLNQIQASEEEMMAQLQVLNACEIGGSVTSTVHNSRTVARARERLWAPSLGHACLISFCLQR